MGFPTITYIGKVIVVRNIVMEKVRIAYIDLEYWDEERGRTCGDMGYSFEDEPNTRVPIGEIDEHRRHLEEYINSEEADENGECEKDGFAVYSLVIADAYVEDDDRLDIAEVDKSRSRVTDVYVCATEEWAKCRVEKEFTDKGIVFHYRSDNGMFN